MTSSSPKTQTAGFAVVIPTTLGLIWVEEVVLVPGGLSAIVVQSEDGEFETLGKLTESYKAVSLGALSEASESSAIVRLSSRPHSGDSWMAGVCAAVELAQRGEWKKRQEATQVLVASGGLTLSGTFDAPVSSDVDKHLELEMKLQLLAQARPTSLKDKRLSWLGPDSEKVRGFGFDVLLFLSVDTPLHAALSGTLSAGTLDHASKSQPREFLRPALMALAVCGSITAVAFYALRTPSACDAMTGRLSFAIFGSLQACSGSSTSATSNYSCYFEVKNLGSDDLNFRLSADANANLLSFAFGRTAPIRLAPNQVFRDEVISPFNAQEVSYSVLGKDGASDLLCSATLAYFRSE